MAEQYDPNNFQRQQPFYGPFQSPGGMNDPLSLVMMMFGPQFLQQVAGPGKFLPHQTPGQAVMDQFLAHKYQRDTFANTMFAAETGDDAVQRKVLGVMSALTGQQPSQLNREQAGTIAGIVNNPITKSILGSFIGAENMEGILFGSRGDPSAIASAVNRMGYYRQDPTSGKDMMSERSLQRFTSSMYDQLYGKHANVDDMRGFQAGQAGEIMDYMFQRGTLPQSIGALKPADRAKLVSGSFTKDDPALDVLAREFGHREMMKDENYAGMTEEEQKIELEKNVGTYRKRLTDTLDNVEELRKADPRRMSPEERDKKMKQVEGTEEFQMLSTHVDAKRVSETLKGYAGAVKAVQEIFGDNGNANAPMGALLQALEGLSMGSAAQMKPEKIEATLRQMRLAAKETGMGMDQMLGNAGQIDAMGDTLGIARPNRLQTHLNAMTALSATERAGAFNNPRFNALSKEEAMQAISARMLQGQASPVGKTMAAMARAVAENPEKYKGTEVEAMVKAYNDPKSKGVYTYDGKTHDLGQIAGEQGPQGLASRFEKSGGNLGTLEAYYFDAGTQEFEREDAAFLAQPHEMRRAIANRMASDMYGQVNSKDFDRVRGLISSGSDKEYAEAKQQFADDVTTELSTELASEGAKLDQKDRPKFLQERAPEAIKRALMKRNPGMTEKQAEAAAEKIMPAMFGDSAADQRDAFARMSSNVNSEMKQRSGLDLTQNEQVYRTARDGSYQQRQGVLENRSRRMANVARGNEKSVAGRFGDLLDSLGTGQQADFEDAVEQLTGMMSVTEMGRKFGPELAEALAAAGKTYEDASLDEREIADHIDAAMTGDAKAVTALKQLAGVDAKTTVVGKEEAKKRLTAKSDADIDLLYSAHGSGKAKSKEEKIEELSRTGGAVEAAGLVAEGEYTTEQLGALAMQRAYTAAGYTEDEIKNNEVIRGRAENLTAGLMDGTDVDKVKLASEEMAKLILGDKAASPEIIKQIQRVAQGRKGTEDDEEERAALQKLLKAAGADEDKAKKVMMFSEALRDAKEVDMAGNRLDQTQDQAMREAAQQRQREEQKRATREAADQTEKDTLTAAEEPAAVIADPELAEAARRKKYDYKRLGVTDRVTQKQQEIIDRVSVDPTGEKFRDEISSIFGGDVREAMLTLPDAAAIELFDKFDPDAQTRGLEQLKAAKNNRMLTPEQRENASRLYDAISNSKRIKDEKDKTEVKVEETKQRTEQTEQTRGFDISSPELMEEMGRAIARQTGLPEKEAIALVKKQATKKMRDEGTRAGLPPADDDDDEKEKSGPAREGVKDFERQRKKKAANTDEIAATQAVEEGAKEAARQAARTVFPNQNQNGQGGAGGNMQINGTLTLRGMREAVIQATGTPPAETPDGGASVHGT